MKNFIFTAVLLAFCAISAQAQTPTMQDLIDKVMQNFTPIDSLHVNYTMELYRPSVGLEPPDSLKETKHGEFAHFVHFEFQKN